MPIINSSHIIVPSWSNPIKNIFSAKETINYYIHDSEGWLFDLATGKGSYTYVYEHYTGEENYIDYVFNSIDPHISLDFQRTYSSANADILIFMLGNWSSPDSFGFTYSPYLGDVEIYWKSTNEYSYLYGNYGTLKDNDAYTILHEIGHALGLSHPQLNGSDDPYGSWHDSEDTVMSYNFEYNSNLYYTDAPIWTSIDINALQSIWGEENIDSTPPVINAPSYKYINENTTFVYTFTANEAVDWSIDPISLDFNLFTIDSTNGVLSFKSAPDYENPIDSNLNGVYTINVQATDLSNNTSKHIISVRINDVAEESIPPIISGPSHKSIDENTTFVHTFTANEIVTWSINSTSLDFSLFTINATTGVLNFKNAPDYENPTDSNFNGVYTINIKATDMAGNYSNQIISVSINDVNESISYDSIPYSSISNQSTKLQQLYIAYFGRAADPAGLNYWTSVGISTKDFAANMYLQPEFNSVNADLPVSQQVNQIYQNLFNRDGDSAGILYWVSEINTGSLQLASIANDLIWAATNNSTTNQGLIDKKTLENKTNVAVFYTTQIEKSPSLTSTYVPQSTNPWISGKSLLQAKSYLKSISNLNSGSKSGVDQSINAGSTRYERLHSDGFDIKQSNDYLFSELDFYAINTYLRDQHRYDKAYNNSEQVLMVGNIIDEIDEVYFPNYLCSQLENKSSHHSLYNKSGMNGEEGFDVYAIQEKQLTIFRDEPGIAQIC